MSKFKLGERVKLPDYFGGHIATVLNPNAGNDRVQIRTVQPLDGIRAELTIHEDRLTRATPLEPKEFGTVHTSKNGYRYVRIDRPYLGNRCWYRVDNCRPFDEARSIVTWEEIA